MTANVFGLKRPVPAEVKRVVRQRCGFGCVLCGLGIVQYEHVDPEFKDAATHDADAITLLCPRCHAKVTTGMLAKEQVKQAMLDPCCKRTGYARETFAFSGGPPALRFGGMLLKDCPIPIEVKSVPLFSIKQAEDPNGPFLLSGHFTDSNGNQSLVIEDNEWQASSTCWDVEVKGPTITIREGLGRIHLKLVFVKPNEIFVDRLNMSLYGLQFEANGDFLRIRGPGGLSQEYTSCLSDHCNVGLSLG